MRGILIGLLFVLAALPAWAQSTAPDPFAQTVRWDVQESWNTDQLIYTFSPNGTFQSSDWDNGKGRGTWLRDGQSLTMIWPQYGAIYRGTIGDDEIRGTANSSDGREIGTFIFHLHR